MCSNTELASPLIKMYRVGDTNKKWLTMKRVLLLMFLLVATVGTQAQNDDFFKRTGFDEFRKSIFDDYKDFRTKMLKDYTDFLRKAVHLADPAGQIVAGKAVRHRHGHLVGIAEHNCVQRLPQR